MWLSLGVGLHARTMEDVDKLSDQDKVDASTTVTEAVCTNAANLLGSTALDISWSNLLAADSSIIRGLAQFAQGNKEAAMGIFQNALEMTEAARSDGECLDQRVMAMGYAVGARALFAMGEQGTAFGAYKNAITCIPDSVSLWEVCFCLLFLIASFDIEKKNVCMQELGEAYADSNLWQQSVVSLMQALSNCRTVSSQAIVLTRLAKLYLIQENREEATSGSRTTEELGCGG
ncbi:hypothetical protein BDR26DRAFT_71057 [Obelidium mucronatum]|nr:hypothetical protein BDR26DRAFT_71057 [Obelidium mucronatum]